jgi:copper chaperone CopZ
MPELSLFVRGMGCRGCVRDVTARLRDVAGVEWVVADVRLHQVRLHGSMSLSDVRDALAPTTFAVSVLPQDAEPGGTAGT